MKKLVLFGLLAGAVAAAILLVKKSQSSVSAEERAARQKEKRRAMVEKMRACMEAMPEDFPPVAMFNNVAATRENSERILELLEQNRSDADEPAAAATTTVRRRRLLEAARGASAPVEDSLMWRHSSCD